MGAFLLMNEQNLIPFEKGCRSTEEAQKNGRKGGVASGVARRRKRSLKKTFEQLLSMEPTADAKEAMEDAGITIDDMTNFTVIAVSAMRKAMSGDVSAMRFIADVTGGYTMTEHEKQKAKLEKERLQLERERLEMEKERRNMDKKTERHVTIINDLGDFDETGEAE